MQMLSHPPNRIVLILPCCIGDVVLATATLKALRRAFPRASIAWAVGTWSRAVIENHPDVNEILDTGKSALPVKSLAGFGRFVRKLRAGQYDLAVSLVRSPLMSLAVRLSGIPVRAGLDSDGRGRGYNIRAAVDPNKERHEAEIYLDVARAMGLDVSDCRAYVPVNVGDSDAARHALASVGVTEPFAVINPAGGQNPGMMMDAKRYPPAGWAAIIRGLRETGLHVVLAAGPDDGPIVSSVQRELAPSPPAPALVGILTLRQIGALGSIAQVYVGNDTGLTHLAAASGAKTVMLMGPSSPARYAPFTENSVALWKPAQVPVRGVVSGVPADWDWARDGIEPTDALSGIVAFMKS